MPPEPDERVGSALIGLDQTITQIGKIVALGREAVEGDEFLPLAAQQLGVRLGYDAAALPEDWRSERPDIPWSGIQGLRNRLAHNYHQIDFDILWDVFSVDVPALRAALADDLASARSARATGNDAEADKQ